MSNDDGISDDRSRQIDVAIAEYLDARDQGSPLRSGCIFGPARIDRGATA